MNKNEIDKQAEREGKALTKQGRHRQLKHIREQLSDYNKAKFDMLFKD